MNPNLRPVVLRSACGTSRRIMVDKSLEIFIMPMLPYKKNAGIDYYTGVYPEGTEYRVFRANGEHEWGAYDLKADVFSEVVKAKEPV